MRARSILLALSIALPVPAFADTALILANARYAEVQNLRTTRDFLRLEDDLQAAGFDVIVVENGDAGALRQGLSELLDADEDARVLIAAVGHFVRSSGGGESWLAGTDANRPDLAGISGQGLPVSVMAEVAASAPGRAMVLLGLENRQFILGRGLEQGLGPVEPPQGVTVISGPTRDLSALVRGPLLTPGTDLSAVLERTSSLTVSGFVSPALPFTAEATAPQPAPPAPQPPSGPSAEELALWEAAEELNTPAAYNAYLQRYPQGAFAAIARERAAAPQPTPEEVAQANEDALNLDRDARRQVQRYLTILGYDTRGIDGIFGNGTRTAIRSWQAAQGVAVTGYLNAPQLAALSEQGRVRQAEIEEEERLRREAEARADRAYWQATGQGQTEQGLRDYLDRYPDGLFADVAEARLADILAAREGAAWQAARQTNTVASYRAYLDDYPNGTHADDARARIEALQSGLTPEERARLEAQEAALNLQPITRSLIEQRLDRLGFNPGRVDGRFDADTRRAIRRYQQARGLPVTGYLDQVLVVRLLAESIGGILR